MNRFFIVTNDRKDKDYQVTNKVKELLETAGKECFLSQKDEYRHIVREAIPEGVDCAIVIGGDGTFIEAARALVGRNVPILGINMGTLGYLTEVEVSNIESAIEQIVRNDFTLESRMMLEGVFENGDTDTSLNDIIVARKNALRVIHFDLYVGGELLNSYVADGVIISTPTGSTAYNLSAGGPIIQPTAEMIVITPICSHALNTSSVVISAEDEIEIKIGKGKNDTVEEVLVAFDGEDPVTLFTGDVVKIRKSAASTKIMKLSKVSFLEILRRKMKGN